MVSEGIHLVETLHRDVAEHLKIPREVANSRLRHQVTAGCLVYISRHSRRSAFSNGATSSGTASASGFQQQDRQERAHSPS